MNLRNLNFKGGRGKEGGSSAVPAASNVDVNKLLQPTGPAGDPLTRRRLKQGATVAGAFSVLGLAGACGVDGGSQDTNFDRPQYGVFHPEQSWNLTQLRAEAAPSDVQVLAAHGLNTGDVKEYRPAVNSWEPGIHAYELSDAKIGNTTIPLIEGYVYTVAMQDGSVQILWGGDPNIPTADVQWGFTARWYPSYEKSADGQWLQLDNPIELAVREYRFGRYLRNEEMQGVRPDVIYHDRVGPYYTDIGNLDTKGWVPPSLNTTAPRADNPIFAAADAAAIYGGTSNPAEWTFGERAGGVYLNGSWKSEHKGTPEPAGGDNRWQTVYAPTGPGYVEIWVSKGNTGPDGNPVSVDGPYKFGQGTNPILVDGQHNADEFSFHAVPGR